MLFYNVVILFLVIAGVDYASKKHVAAKRGLSVNPKRLMKHLGILTPYKFNANYNLMLGNEHSGCATKIWMIVGYGTSYPTEKHINKMSDELFQVRQQIIGGFAQKKSKLSFKTIGEFDRWKPLIEDTGDALKLSAQGQKEMFNLAKRMQKRFPEIFPKKFSNKTYLFRYASDGRIKNCANYFAQGLFENKNEVRRVFFPRPNEKDMPIIRAHTACQKYKDDVSESDAAWADIEKFYDSQDMQYAIQKTNQFLGTDLTNDEVELMYITCAYESGWMKSISTWCNAFDLETIKPFEYVDDLTQYWYHGYGYKVTSKLACMAVRDAVLFFNDYACCIEKIISRLGTKTPYRINANYNYMSDVKSVCAKKIWMIVAHGTTYPNKDDLKTMKEALPKLKRNILTAFAQNRSNLSYSQMKEIDEWKTPAISSKFVSRLSPQGEVEIQQLAKRMQLRYPHIFFRVYDDKTYTFKVVREARYLQTAQNFAIGLFGEDVGRDLYIPPATLDDEHVLRPYKYCAKWLERIAGRGSIVTEIDRFYKRKYLVDAAKKIRNQLGIPQLSLDNIKLMYTACGYETASLKTGVSPWCIPFENKNAKVFEYLDDLEQYWINGYGYTLTGKQACIMASNLLRFLDDQRIKSQARIYFTDPASVLHLATHLEFFKSRMSLTSKTFRKNTKWRSSHVAGFGINMAFISYKCTNTKFVSVAFNERLQNLKFCGNKTACDYDTFMRHYMHSVTNCKREKLCQNFNKGHFGK
ncbi:hypothetical protein Trydic_g13777 [Trypoxylus dichotomus]